MSLKLHCKRTKLFMRTHNDKHEQVTANAGAVTTLPDWVKDTIGYSYGVKDGSIVDLTPPKPIEPANAIVEAVDAEAGEEPVDEGQEKGSEKPAKASKSKSRVPPGIIG